MAMFSHIINLQKPNIPLSKADKISIFRSINSLVSDNFLLNKIFGQIQNVGVNYVTSIASSAEAYREVGRGPSVMMI